MPPRHQGTGPSSSAALGRAAAGAHEPPGDAHPRGETLPAEGGAALEAVAAAVRRTRRAGAAGSRLVLAMKPGGDGGGLLPEILAAYEREPEAFRSRALAAFVRSTTAVAASAATRTASHLR
ncbi:hypothetical protein ACQEU6_06290 [Spirillospora sp. CA-108201]